MKCTLVTPALLALAACSDSATGASGSANEHPSSSAPPSSAPSTDAPHTGAAPASSAPEVPQPSIPQSNWDVTEEVNPLDDSKTTILSLRSSDSVPGTFGATHPVLIFRNMSGELSAYIATQEFLGSDSMEVITRVDKAPAEKKQWGISTDHKGVFAPNPSKFLAELRAADKLVVSLTPFSDSPITFTYDLAGLDAAAARLSDSGPAAAAGGATAGASDDGGEAVSNWNLTEEVNPLDDSKTTVLALESSDSVPGTFGSSKPVLILRHKSGELSGYIVIDQFLGSDSMEVTTRIDKATAKKSQWGISTDHKAVFAPNPSRFLSDLKRADKLVVSLTPYSESPITFSFELYGLSDYAGKLK